MSPAALYHEIRTLPAEERLWLAHRILHDLVEPLTGSASEHAPRPILVAPPLTVEPLVFEECAEILGRIVGLAHAHDGSVAVKLRSEDSRSIVDMTASDELGKVAARYFGQNVRALVIHEHVGERSSTSLEEITPWDPDDLLSVLRSVRDDLASRGVVVDAGAWLAELE